MNKLWGGRFEKETAGEAEAFLNSLVFDSRLWRQDIRASIAHARMLGRQGIVDLDEADQIVRGFEQIQSDIERGSLEFDPVAEDIHSFIEACLVARIGEAGKKLHTARSRNDQVATDLRLYLKEEIASSGSLLLELIGSLLHRAGSTERRSCPAIPTCSGRSRSLLPTTCWPIVRCCGGTTTGCGTVTGAPTSARWGRGHWPGRPFPSTGPILPAPWISRRLQATAWMRSLTGTLHGGVYLCRMLAIMTHLSRFAEEFVYLVGSRFGFITLDDAYTTGSSIMPQKKNPDVPELVRGKAGRVYGRLLGILTTLKGLPLAYNKASRRTRRRSSTPWIRCRTAWAS